MSKPRLGSSSCRTHRTNASNRGIRRNTSNRGIAVRRDPSEARLAQAGAKLREIQERLVLIRVHDLPIMPDFAAIGGLRAAPYGEAHTEEPQSNRVASGDPPRRGPPAGRTSRLAPGHGTRRAARPPRRGSPADRANRRFELELRTLHPMTDGQIAGTGAFQSAAYSSGSS